MENASKALLFAAGVLMAIVILSLALYLYGNFSSATAEMEKQMEEDQISNFNNQFLAYEEKKEITIYDIYTVSNLAEENNKKYDLTKQEDNNYYVSVNLKTKTESINNIEKNKLDYNGFINKYMYVIGQENNKDVYDLTRFTCKVQINEITRRVNKVEFSQN